MFKFFKFFVLALCMQICVSASDDDQVTLLAGDANFRLPSNHQHCDYDSMNSNFSAAKKRSANVSEDFNVSEYFLDLPAANIRVPISVLDMITEKDNSHLLKHSVPQSCVVTLSQLQKGLKQFDQLFAELTQSKCISSIPDISIAEMVHEMPFVKVQFDGGKVAVSKIVFDIFMSGKSKDYSPIENLLINFCCFQAEAAGELIRLNVC